MRGKKTMGLFSRKKKEQPAMPETEKLSGEMRDDISKAYDELISGKSNVTEEQAPAAAPETEVPQQSTPANNAPNADFEMELLKTRIKEFKEKKTQETLMDVIKMLPNRKFLLPAVSNMEKPFENVNGEVRLKKGAAFNPALLTANDKKTFLPIFTDEKSVVQKSPSGVLLQFKFEQCVGIVYNKKNPVVGITINPFTENFIIGEELLRQVFKEIPKDGANGQQNA